MATFIGGAFGSAEEAFRAGVPGFDALGQHAGWEVVPGAVVATEDYQSIVVDSSCFKFAQDLTGGPIEGFDCVAIEASTGAAAAAGRGADRKVRHGIGEVKEEGVAGGLADEVDCFIGVAFCELGLVGDGFDCVIVAPEVEGALGLDPGRDHVVAVEEAEVLIEATAGGEIFFGAVTDVPFADGGGLVALRFHLLGDCDLREGEAADGFGPEVGWQAGAFGVAAGKEAHTGWCADAGGSIARGEADAFGGKAIQIGRLDIGVTVAGQVAVAHVVGKENDDVWLRLGKRLGGGRCAAQLEDLTSSHVTSLLVVIDLDVVGSGDDFFGLRGRDEVVVVKFHHEAGAALGHGGEIVLVAEHFRHRDGSFNAL